MTLLLTEGFDWLETADLPAAYGAFSIFQPLGTMTDTIEETGGRNGQKSLKIIPGTASNDGVTYNMQGYAFPTSVSAGATLIAAFAVKFTAAVSDAPLTFAAISSLTGVDASKFNLLLQRTTGGLLAAGKSQGVNSII
ncbi:MAG: hypothetical protein E4G91_09895, partial [Candidatus Zixiibacteriota bacterium]